MSSLPQPPSPSTSVQINDSESRSIGLAPKNPGWLRLTHALNAIAWTIMTLSGVLIYWANDAYTPFLKPAFYKALGLDHKLALGLALHFSFMWLFIGCGLYYVARLVTSGEWREIVPRKTDFRLIPQVALAEMGFGKMPPSNGKFNPAQRCVYFGVLILAALEVGCGFAIYKPFQLHTLQMLLGGYETARLIHFAITALLIAFFFIHVAQVIRAGARDFFSMVISTTPDMPFSVQLRRSLITLASTLLVLVLIFGWLRTRPEDNGIVWPMREVLNFNGWIAERVLKVDSHETIAASLEASLGGSQPRVNGAIGLENDLEDDDATFDLSAPGRPKLPITMDRLSEFPQTSSSASFRCIEGWSRPITYKGVRFRDLMIATGLGTKSGRPYSSSTPREDLYSYVGFETANGKYYVSIDIASLLNDQSVLATQMNGMDLSFENGAPLRLVIPMKYGIKNIKRIKHISFSDSRPHDYWEERGYDWFAGL